MQQVNLFLPIFRKEEKIFSAVTMVKIYGIFIVALMLVFAAGFMQESNLKNQLQTMKIQQMETEQQLVQLKKTHPQSQEAKLELELQRLRTDVNKRRGLRDVITRQRLGNDQGFSPFLEELSRQHVRGVSLTDFALLQGGSYLEMSGWARNADLVPEYISRLQDGDTFVRTRFGVLVVERDKKRNDAMYFTVSRPGRDKKQ